MIRMTGNHWVGQERILSQSLQRKYGPANSLSSDFSLQNCKIISFYCFKPSRLWPFVSAAAGKWIHLLIQVHGHLANDSADHPVEFLALSNPHLCPDIGLGFCVIYKFYINPVIPFREESWEMRSYLVSFSRSADKFSPLKSQHPGFL